MPNDVMDAMTRTGVPSSNSEDATKQAVAANPDGGKATAAAGSDDEAKTPIPAAQIADLDPRALVGSNPKFRDFVAGVEGSALQRGRAEGERTAREKLEAKRAEEDRQAREAQIDTLLETDPLAAAEVIREDRAVQRAESIREAEEQRQRESLLSVADQYDNVLLGAVEMIPEEYRSPVARDYPGTIEGRQQLVNDLIQAARESGHATAAQQYEIDLAAARAEANNARMQTAVRPDYQSGPLPAEDISKLTPFEKLKRAFSG